MAFKTVSALEAEVTISLGGKDKKTGKANPKSAEGYYLGRREVAPGKFSRPGKKDYIYFLQTEAGNVGVWGKTDLDRKMGQVTPGTMIRISHSGMRPTPNGDMHTYQVEVDEDNTIDASGYSAAGNDDGGDVNEDTEGLDNDETDDNDNEPVTLPKGNTSTAAERQAKVAALLGRKGNKVS